MMFLMLMDKGKIIDCREDGLAYMLIVGRNDRRLLFAPVQGSFYTVDLYVIIGNLDKEP